MWPCAESELLVLQYNKYNPTCCVGRDRADEAIKYMAYSAQRQTVTDMGFDRAGDVKVQLVSWQLKFNTNDTVES